MVKWLSRQEKIASYDFYRSWLEEFQRYEVEDEEEAGEQLHQERDEDGITVEVGRNKVYHKPIGGETSHKVMKGQMILSKQPAEPRKSLTRILISHAAPGFLSHLKLFLNSHVWHQYKFSPTNLFDDESDSVQEIVKAVPICQKSNIPRFDTVIVLVADKAESTAVQGAIYPEFLLNILMSIGQVVGWLDLGLFSAYLKWSIGMAFLSLHLLDGQLTH